MHKVEEQQSFRMEIFSHTCKYNEPQYLHYAASQDQSMASLLLSSPTSFLLVVFRSKSQMSHKYFILFHFKET